MHKNIYDTIIIGSGCAGCTAAIYATRYKLKTLMIGKDFGLLAEAAEVENFPGFKKISGIELLKKFHEHCKALGVEILQEEVTKIVKDKKENLFKVFTRENEYFGKTIIIAIGLARRKLNIPGEEKLIGRGISYCATCDAAFTKDKVAAVVGGADSAAMAALLIAKYAKKVYIFYRRAALRAQPYLVDRIKKEKKIEVVYNSNVIEAIGEKKLERVKLKISKENGEEEIKEIPLSFLFIEIGSVPNTVLLKDLNIKLDERNFIVCNEKQETSTSGIFACGDITNNIILRQAITAAAQGAVAAYSAYLFLQKEKKIS